MGRHGFFHQTFMGGGISYTSVSQTVGLGPPVSHVSLKFLKYKKKSLQAHLPSLQKITAVGNPEGDSTCVANLWYEVIFIPQNKNVLIFSSNLHAVDHL